jgi:NAD-reducing hydrogenase small subunit
MEPLSAPPAPAPGVRRPRLATAWLGGCSGCHMSFLDLDERLLDLAGKMDLVYSPFSDVKVFPEGVDVALVEGACANQDHLLAARIIRARSRFVIAFGDCAVTGNVTAIRNALGCARPVLDRAYLDASNLQPGVPGEPGLVPGLLDQVLPLHQVVAVDAWLPGCPPHPDLIQAVLLDALAGRTPDLRGRLHFG